MSGNRSHRKVLWNSSWLVGDRALSSIFGALQTIIVARTLGVEEYGLLVLVTSYIDILDQLFDFRNWESAIKYIGTFWESGDPEKARSMIKLSYLIDFSSGALGLVVAVLTGKAIGSYIIHSQEAFDYIRIYALSLFIGSSSSTSLAILRVFDKFRSIALLRSAQYLFRLILVTLFLLAGFKIYGVLYGMVIAGFLGSVTRAVVVVKVLKEKGLGDWWKSKLGSIREQIKGIAWFTVNTNLAATIKIGQDKFLGTMVLGYFAGKDAVAFYKIASSASTIMNYVAVPLYEAIYPEFVKIVKTGKAEQASYLKPLIKYTTKTYLKIGLPLALIIILFSDIIITLAFGKSYLPSASALRVIASAALIDGLAFWVNPALLATERPGTRTALGLISTIVYLAFVAVLVPPYSFIGAAYAYLGYVIIRTILSFRIFYGSKFGFGQE
ncbi:MAG TPA: oligosaccharide flippase family protein [Thermodesulfobacteriota bacterium]|nr:oligosaccharide flippase family protein [Thermodesulfobacteriota bacterium]